MKRKSGSAFVPFISGQFLLGWFSWVLMFFKSSVFVEHLYLICYTVDMKSKSVREQAFSLRKEATRIPILAVKSGLPRAH